MYFEQVKDLISILCKYAFGQSQLKLGATLRSFGPKGLLRTAAHRYCFLHLLYFQQKQYSLSQKKRKKENYYLKVTRGSATPYNISATKLPIIVNKAANIEIANTTGQSRATIEDNANTPIPGIL